MSGIERIEVLERENELLKEQIKLLNKIIELKDEKKTTITYPWTYSHDPWEPTVTYTSSSDDTIRTIYANEKTGDA